ncbi:hypothetical protein F4781DRAFT_441874 [Annulohypoxylon bovei var. microspora]|nr:hypothetical protein F4781DRAFT_441874 [Annulohypoxylon bovei var. microspora]
MEDTPFVQECLTATDLSSMPDEIILQRTLTTKSIISTPSSFIHQSEQPLDRRDRDLQMMTEIGKGFQGSIFEKVGCPLALKKEHPGNERLRSNLTKEYALHRALLDAVHQYGTIGGVRVPFLFSIVRSTDVDFWDSNLSKFPFGYRNPGTLVKMERILPLPKISRKALINCFYPREGNTPLDTTLAQRILEDISNKHCLVRPYLGKYDNTYTREKFSSLEHLQLDTVRMASSMGNTYAMMHWGSGINGDDVEFVLGTSTVREPGTNTADSQKRSVGLYLIDFGQCEWVDLSEDCEVVYQAFKGAMVTGDNQLFIPNYQKSPELFAAFKGA